MIRPLLLVSAAALILGAAVADRPRIPPATTSPPVGVAHRGHPAGAPENTMASVDTALAAGASWIEVDARTTADGVWVVMHDKSVDRTTDGTGAVADLTTEQVAELDAGVWFSPRFADEPVPTVDAVLDRIESTGTHLLLEVKGPQPPDAVAELVRSLGERDLLADVIVISFDEQVLAAAARAEPGLRIGLLRVEPDPDPVAAARRVGASLYAVDAGPLLERTDRDGGPDLVQRLRAAGIQAMAYTVDDAATWRRLDALELDLVATDRIGAYLDWRR